MAGLHEKTRCVFMRARNHLRSRLHMCVLRQFAPLLVALSVAAGCGRNNEAVAPTPVVDSDFQLQTQALVVRPTCAVPTNLVVEDLGTFGKDPSIATDINEQGQVFGLLADARRAVPRVYVPGRPHLPW